VAGDARVVAVDLGASSGRVYAVDVGPGRLALAETGRFANGGVRLGARLYWDVLALYQGTLAGVAAAGRDGPVHSIGIDTWAVDYGLVRADGTLIGNLAHHRDRRTGEAVDAAAAAVDAPTMWRRTGVAAQPFNTVYQLLADLGASRLDDAASVLLVPDLLAFFLTGEAGSEVTNASTTGMLAVSGDWDRELLERLGIPDRLLTALRRPGDPAGRLRREVAADTALPGAVAVTTVASHDTASAVAAVPAAGADFAYISCGTWSLVGVELDAPILSEEARLAGFTNERGVDGTWRFLRNVVGLWLLQECIRAWEMEGGRFDMTALVDAAADVRPLRSVIDADDLGLLEPGDMPARIARACRQAGMPAPGTAAEVTRTILDSLALSYRRAVTEAAALSGVAVSVVHLVGGGARNRLLCQLTADACGVPVVAGPVEAAAIGNALVQARTLGALDGDRWDLRACVAAHSTLERYLPRPEMVDRYAAAAASVAVSAAGQRAARSGAAAG
jgi:rhamnulokinase